jgi:hypothetical protein
MAKILIFGSRVWVSDCLLKFPDAAVFAQRAGVWHKLGRRSAPGAAWGLRPRRQTDPEAAQHFGAQGSPVAVGEVADEAAATENVRICPAGSWKNMFRVVVAPRSAPW